MSTKEAMRVTFKLDAYETGLRAIGAGPRGYTIRLNGKDVGSIGPLGGSAFTGPLRGWYYVVHSLGEYVNTCAVSGVSLEDTKKAAKACVLSRAATPSEGISK